MVRPLRGCDCSITELKMYVLMSISPFQCLCPSNSAYYQGMLDNVVVNDHLTTTG